MGRKREVYKTAGKKMTAATKVLGCSSTIINIYPPKTNRGVTKLKGKEHVIRDYQAWLI